MLIIQHIDDTYDYKSSIKWLTDNMLKIMKNEIAYLRYATKMRPVLDLCNRARNAIQPFHISRNWTRIWNEEETYVFA